MTWTLRTESPFSSRWLRNCWTTGTDRLVSLRNELVVIVAGYGEEMTQFTSSNPGLPSRFPWTIRFPDYSTEELLSIFKGMCDQDRYQVTADGLDGLRQYLARLPRTREFGNGRLVPNLFEAAVARQASRIVSSGGTDLTTLTLHDLGLDEPPLQNMSRAKSRQDPTCEVITKIEAPVGPSPRAHF
jgi:AAA lid domain